MRRPIHGIARILAVAVAALSAAPAPAQERPDLNGLWDGARSSSDLVETMKDAGSFVPFTPEAAERYRNVDFATNPNAQCLPPGPSRAITGPSPFQIVQTDDIIAILFENHGRYRVIYMDGRHSDGAEDYPSFMGDSAGRWEGDTLVVDTIGINDRTWLDSNGIEHSDRLRLTERFTRTGPDSIAYEVTYDDPEFFTEPWTVTLPLVRQGAGDRLIEYVCNENERDLETLQPTFLNRDKVLGNEAPEP